MVLSAGREAQYFSVGHHMDTDVVRNMALFSQVMGRVAQFHSQFHPTTHSLKVRSTFSIVKMGAYWEVFSIPN